MERDAALPLEIWEREIVRLSAVPFYRGDHALEMARAQALIEEILDAYPQASEPERKRLRALCRRHPRFFADAEWILWTEPDPLATARLRLLFLSLLGRNDDPDWGASVDDAVRKALGAAPPADRHQLARLLRWVASISDRSRASPIMPPVAEYFEHVAASLFEQAGGDAAGRGER